MLDDEWANFHTYDSSLNANLARARALSSAAMKDDAMAEEAHHPSDDS